MGHYTQGAAFYDLLYAGIKDYRAEAELLAALIREAKSDARTVLDMACGTGEHARWLTELGFRVEGVDLEDAFVAAARRKCPHGTFTVGDMTTFVPERRYDAVLSLFSAVGYSGTTAAMERVVANLAAALEPDGVLIVDPWFEPGQLTDGWVSMVTAEADDVKVCRMSRTRIDGPVSTIEFEYLVGRATGIERFSEQHALGLFTQAEMERAFAAAGLDVRRLPEALRTRGLYVGRKPASAARDDLEDSP